MTKTIVVYETAHVPLLAGWLAAHPGAHVVAIGADVEFTLEETGVTFRSARELRRAGHLERLSLASTLAFEVPKALSFFTYRDIPLSAVWGVALYMYFTPLLYYFDIAISLMEETDTKEVYMFATTQIEPKTSGLLADLSARCVEDVLRLAGETCGVSVTTLPVPRSAVGSSIFELRRTLFGLAIGIVNACISSLPRRRVRILASDYWKHLEALMRKFPEGELFLLDRAESLKAGWRAVWRHRMRFVHAQSYAPRGTRRRAVEQGSGFISHWKDARAGLTTPTFRGYNIGPLVLLALDRVVEVGGPRAVEMIEGTRAMLARVRPEVVLVRASASAQPHFDILCRTARQMGIPSIEMQHGIFYFGEGSYSNYRSVEYVAEYGPVTRQSFTSIGYTDRQLFDVGSPRFDSLIASLGRSTGQRSTLLSILPGLTVGHWTDTYEVVDFIKGHVAAARAARLPLVFSLRSAEGAELYRAAIRRHCAEVEYRISYSDPLPQLLAQAKVVATCHSTTVLEALLSGAPVVYDATLPMHRKLGSDLGSDFATYARDGAMVFAETPESLSNAVKELSYSPERRTAMVSAAHSLMAREYSFDGNSSPRLAEALRSLAVRGDIVL